LFPSHAVNSLNADFNDAKSLESDGAEVAVGELVE
jgi:hypothetical protein